jgi:hypothetical protein
MESDATDRLRHTFNEEKIMNHQPLRTAVIAGLSIIALQFATVSSFAGELTRGKTGARKPAAEKLGNFEIQDIRSAPKVPGKDASPAYQDGAVFSEDNWEARKMPRGNIPTQESQGKLGNFEIQDLKSPRDSASGQATGIDSPRDVASGQATGK